ncbi:helix-turn-helix transcriptional regulator [Variovorax sp. PCZ-1]|uniref:helix-turn-helix domain-containing protein n=1 Tax=Variovorax sp. PCZ-1 TaxID=2835533 RepID=UPI001BD05608|nr:helix-turn-helix transcriptional regulator [Variovorax sp. PCZ-1]MBS7806087.1 helix-turn-helix transcriptional regulator [Variovorax sp. PCZ-1]
MDTPTLQPSLRDTLQTARKSKRISQLELALRMGVSQRHVSFVESGRAQPSRELLLAWLQELQAPLAVRNVALQQAGFAPVYRGSELGDAVLAPVRESLGRLLAAHDPMPAMVMDAAWNVLQMNRGARWMAGALMPALADLPLDQPINLLDSFLHPEGMTKNITNLEEVAPAILAHLRDDASVMPEISERVELLAAQFQKRLGKKFLAQWPRQMAPVLTTRFATQYGELAFFSMFSTFGTPQDITLASLRVEHVFAADDLTRSVVHANVR